MGVGQNLTPNSGQSASPPNNAAPVKSEDRPSVVGLSNKWVWLLALSPLLILVADVGEKITGSDTVWGIVGLILIALTVNFVIYDGKELKKRHINLGVWSWLGCILPFIYGFVRAAKTDKKYGYAINYYVVFLVTAYISATFFPVEEGDNDESMGSAPTQLDSTETAQSAVPAQQNNTGSAPAESRDSRLVNAKGWCWYSTKAYSLTLESNGTASRTHIAELYEEGETTAETGTWSTNGNKITLILDGARETFTYSISGTTLYLGDTEYTKMKEDDITYWDD
jgi:hypothetical protein